MATNTKKTSSQSQSTSKQAKRIAQQARKGQKKPAQGKAEASPSRGGGAFRPGWVALYVGIAVVAVFLLVIAFQDKNERQDAESEGQFGSPEVSGDPLPSQPEAGQADEAVGKTAPDVKGANFQDEEVTIEPDGKGKIVVFLAHWCPHCQAEVPKIQEFIDARGEELGIGKDVEIYAVATSSSSSANNWPPEKWLTAEGWDEPLIVDSENSDVLTAFGMSGGFPGVVVLDGDSKVLFRGNGERPESDWTKFVEMAKSGEAGTAEQTTGESSPSE